LYVDHKINLLGTFDPGDTVVFRFRLFSDPLKTGWGWAIDNIRIQMEEVITALDEDLDLSFAVKIYPNPVSSKAFLQLNLEQPSRTILQVIDQVGRVVDNKDLGVLPGGQSVLEWQPPNLGSGIYLLRFTTKFGLQTERIVVTH